MPSPVDINVVLHERDVFRAYRGLRRENEDLAASSKKAAGEMGAIVSALPGKFIKAAAGAYAFKKALNVIDEGNQRYENYARRGMIGSERAEYIRGVEERAYRRNDEIGRLNKPFATLTFAMKEATDRFVAGLNDILDPGRSGPMRMIEERERTLAKREDASLLGAPMIAQLLSRAGRPIDALHVSAEFDRIRRDREIRNMYQGRQIDDQQRDQMLRLSERVRRTDVMAGVVESIEGVGGGAGTAAIRQALGPADAWKSVTQERTTEDMGNDIKQMLTVIQQIANQMNSGVSVKAQKDLTDDPSKWAPSNFAFGSGL